MNQPNAIAPSQGGKQIQLRSNCTIKIPSAVSKDISFISVFRDLSPLHPGELAGPLDMKKALDSIKLFDVQQVIGHEQTITTEIKNKSKKLKNSFFWPFPLVDITENGMGAELSAITLHKPALILNGHHKVAAMKKRGYSLVPGIVHDYDNEIRLGAWYPVLTVPFEQSLIEKFNGVPCKLEAGMSALASGQAYFLAANGNGTWLFQSKSLGTDYVIDMQLRVLSHFRQEDIFYVPDYNLKYEVVNGNTVLMRQPYTREEVWQQAMKGNPFPPKSTRHEFVRVKMDIPLDWLLMPLDAGNALLQGVLSNVKEHFDELQILN